MSQTGKKINFVVPKKGSLEAKKDFIPVKSVGNTISEKEGSTGSKKSFDTTLKSNSALKTVIDVSGNKKFAAGNLKSNQPLIVDGNNTSSAKKINFDVRRQKTSESDIHKKIKKEVENTELKKPEISEKIDLKTKDENAESENNLQNKNNTNNKKIEKPSKNKNKKAAEFKAVEQKDFKDVEKKLNEEIEKGSANQKNNKENKNKPDFSLKNLFNTQNSNNSKDLNNIDSELENSNFKDSENFTPKEFEKINSSYKPSSLISEDKKDSDPKNLIQNPSKNSKEKEAENIEEPDFGLEYHLKKAKQETSPELNLEKTNDSQGVIYFADENKTSDLKNAIILKSEESSKIHFKTKNLDSSKAEENNKNNGSSKSNSDDEQVKHQIIKTSKASLFFSNLSKFVLEYIKEIFLMPWILILGGFIITSIFFWVSDPEKIQMINLLIPDPSIDIYEVWDALGISILANFSISYFMKDSFPRIKPVLFIFSLGILILFIYMISPIFFDFGGVGNI